MLRHCNRLAVLTIAFVFSATAARAESMTAIHVAAKERVEGSARVVNGLAYPSAQRLSSIDYQGGRTYNDGTFDMTFKYRYIDCDGDAQSHTLRFSFDRGGKVVGEPTIINHSSFWPPFSTLKIAGGLLDELNK